jgi:hypothetical protein
MALVVDVPLNTVIADLDEALRTVLRRDLERHGFEGVEVVFDAPSKEWSGRLTGPTVDLFLYDLREAADRAEVSPTERRGNGQAIVTPPPMQLELTFATTAWTQAVEDEHRLLSQILAILFSYPRLPADLLEGVPGAARVAGAEISVGRPREEKADFWTSIGGSYKASIDLVAHVTIESGASFVRGPQVRTQTLVTRPIGAGPGAMTELHRIGGTVADAEGAPVADAWVALPDLGRWTATDAHGRFRLPRVSAGDHTAIVRTVDGQELSATIAVPGPSVDLVLGGSKRAPSKRTQSS